VCACLASAVYGAGGMLALWVWHETRAVRRVHARIDKLEPSPGMLLVPRGAKVQLSDHFEADPTCPIGQLHELGPARWAVHPRTLADIEAKRLESVQLHTYEREPRPAPLRVTLEQCRVCGALNCAGYAMGGGM
jgi:hypothetical protein